VCIEKDKMLSIRDETSIRTEDVVSQGYIPVEVWGWFHCGENWLL